MRRVYRAWVTHGAALAVLVAAASHASAQLVRDDVADCLVRMGNESANAPRYPGPRLGDVCPDVSTAIQRSQWGAALTVPADDLTMASLGALAELMVSYERPAEAPRAELEAAALDAALDELELREPQKALSIWDRIQQWYDEHFGTQRDEARSWLERWLSGLSVPERVIRYLVIALGVLVVAATAVIVWNELRIAGVLAGGVLRKYSPLTSAAVGDEPHPHDLDDVSRAPLARRPAMLLALVLERLRARSHVPPRDSLTHRELLGAATGLNAEQGDAFRHVVNAAERTTFGGWQPDEPALKGLLERGRALLASLTTETGSR